MITVFILSIVFFTATSILLGWGKRIEVMNNWSKYRANPFYMMTAFLYKPDDDPQSRFEFMQDNFTQVMQSLVADVFKIALAPIFDIFQLTAGGIVGGSKGIQYMQAIVNKCMSAFNSMFEVFDRRYKSILFRSSMTFQKMQTAMERLWAVTVSSVYQSIATISAILSTLDLIIKIVIIILVILVAIVLFLFLFMWPFIPVILGVIGILVTAGMGAAVGGMANTFCFEGSTRVRMADGTIRHIRNIRIGDHLESGTVTARMEFLQPTQLYLLHGVSVTGDHIVWHEGQPIQVRNHPLAKPQPLQSDPISLYCLNTTTHKIRVESDAGSLEFADWEEISDEDLAKWNAYVFETLNPGASWDPANAVLEGEAAFHPATLVLCEKQELIEISKIRPGMKVLDENERPTCVLGVVEIAASEIACSRPPMSAAAWYRVSSRDQWKQTPAELKVGTPASGRAADSKHWYSLITEHGTFRLINGNAVRDYTDVGIRAISDTYEWVLEALGKTGI